MFHSEFLISVIQAFLLHKMEENVLFSTSNDIFGAGLKQNVILTELYVIVS